MSRTLIDVLVERERLLARCARQRDAVAAACEALSGPAAVVDRLAAGGRFVARHPLALAGALATLMALRGRSVLKLAMRGVAFWRLASRARIFMQFLGR